MKQTKERRNRQITKAGLCGNRSIEEAYNYMVSLALPPLLLDIYCGAERMEAKMERRIWRGV
ncbi:hypothetical protein BVRB_2g031010 [Beta vulgaris subsp. vulgaris]|nr:hypothetical protein BVRB_2g031010 [Beta vulgaris subsp. vulgaris]